MFESVTSSPRSFDAFSINSKKRSVSASISANISAVAAHEIATDGVLSINACTNPGSPSSATASRFVPRRAS
jgi:hypothetical protein